MVCYNMSIYIYIHIIYVPIIVDPALNVPLVFGDGLNPIHMKMVILRRWFVTNWVYLEPVRIAVTVNNKQQQLLYYIYIFIYVYAHVLGEFLPAQDRACTLLRALLSFFGLPHVEMLPIYELVHRCTRYYAFVGRGKHRI